LDLGSIAKAYYWHRFFSHQPDLNYDNPAFCEEVLDHALLARPGRRCLRLDAIPYLVEREDTTCENLPETHAIIRQIRAAMDSATPTA
jgi:maltose alpha-D-glucosyltransferase/alpha-amylase